MMLENRWTQRFSYERYGICRGLTLELLRVLWCRGLTLELLELLATSVMVPRPYAGVTIVTSYECYGAEALRWSYYSY